jgi:hypothetical protein
MRVPRSVVNALRSLLGAVSMLVESASSATPLVQVAGQATSVNRDDSRHGCTTCGLTLHVCAVCKQMDRMCTKIEGNYVCTGCLAASNASLRDSVTALEVRVRNEAARLEKGEDQSTRVDLRQAAIEIYGAAIGQIIPDARATGDAREHAQSIANQLLVHVKALEEQLNQARVVAVKATEDPDRSIVEASLLFMREVICEAIYRRRASWDPEHPNSSLELRGIPLTMLVDLVRVDVLFEQPGVLREMAASALDDVLSLQRHRRRGRQDNVVIGPGRFAEMRETVQRITEEHRVLKEELEDWRGAGRALGFETANPRASLLAYKAGWESRRMEAATATVRFTRAKLMERFNQQADVADALRELGAKLPPTKRGVLPELIEKALLDVMDALKDDPEKVFDFDPDEEG